MCHIFNTRLSFGGDQVSAEKVIARIYGKKRGWCFSSKDFLDLGSYPAVSQALLRLERKGTIRRLLQGIYEYPRESQFLVGWASPDPDGVAQAIARTNGWTIVPEGNTALNILGLSTQVPSVWEYLSDGPSRSYKWDGGNLKFFSRASKETSGLSYRSAVLVQGLKSLGIEQIDDHLRATLKNSLTPKEWALALKECQYVTTWVYELIKEVAGGIAHA
jgi:hypothetical protein